MTIRREMISMAEAENWSCELMAIQTQYLHTGSALFSLKVLLYTLCAHCHQCLTHTHNLYTHIHLREIEYLHYMALKADFPFAIFLLFSLSILKRDSFMCFSADCFNIHVLELNWQSFWFFFLFTIRKHKRNFFSDALFYAL